MADTLKRHFDALAASNDEVAANGYGRSEGPPPHRFVADAIAAVIEPRPEHRLLDIGCGTGEILRLLAPTISGVGLDISPVMVERARLKGVEALVYDGRRLPFSEASFDRVLIYQVLVNFVSKNAARKLVEEALRITRPGGLVLIGAIPHPKWSRFRQHGLILILRHRISEMLGHAPLSCFAFDLKFFADIAQRAACTRCEICQSPIPLPGWSEKYDVLLQKPPLQGTTSPHDRAS